jgi:hypothetical protein
MEEALTEFSVVPVAIRERQLKLRSDSIGAPSREAAQNGSHLAKT